MERTGLLPGAKSPYLKDYAERWLEEYRLNVKPTTYRTRAGRIHACMEVIGCIRLTELTPDHIRQCMRVLSKRLAPSTLKDHFVSLKMMLDQAELEELTKWSLSVEGRAVWKARACIGGYGQGSAR